ncbi:unnamed protein product, partial [Amoebophrya sp. A25]
PRERDEQADQLPHQEGWRLVALALGVFDCSSRPGILGESIGGAKWRRAQWYNRWASTSSRSRSSWSRFFYLCKQQLCNEHRDGDG